MSPDEPVLDPFAIKDCSMIAIATGKRAQSLRDLRQHLNECDHNTLYYHFWGGLLRPKFDDPEYHNDFAIWIHRQLHDKILAERLSLIDPTEFPDMEALRQELMDIIEERLDELEYPLWSTRGNHFEFIRSQIVIFNTNYRVEHPFQFTDVLPSLSVGSVFYHFIDARRRTEESIDDFRSWLLGFGDQYMELCDRIAGIDPYFSTLSELRAQLTEVFGDYFENGSNHNG
ncbi:MAG: hypothetical protein GF307_12680 [candidate division Zixibacteria bacterium]|nr:hypothetical protein [candidate division Zixibacteria bacterium]